MSVFGRYATASTTVDAVQFTEENKDRVRTDLTGQHAACFEDGIPVLKVTTAHGDVATVRFGDWIVQDIEAGTYYPVKNEVFVRMYAKSVDTPDII